MANGTRVRQDIWDLSKANVWDPTILWYAKAVGDMQKRPTNDPTSWAYQAAIHGFGPETPRPAPPLPPKSEQTRYWKQCQHSTWYFLPWHRVYLFYFEQIVAATVAKLGGPAGWSLPYWNYCAPLTANPSAWQLPPAFRERNLPDGTPNPLLVETRDKGNQGENVADARSVSLRCLTDANFGGRDIGDPGFGGPDTAFPNHMGGHVPGQLESVPHNMIHDDVGGLMGDPNTAALDPIFYVHHSNVDRMWVVWAKRDPGHKPPADAGWLNQAFQFHDATKNPAQLKAAQILDTTAAPLSYKYQDESDPLAAGGPVPGGG